MLLMDEYSCSILTVDDKIDPVLIRFEGCTQVKFGYPNEEALRGREIYGDCPHVVVEVFGSDWFDALQEQNSIRFPDVKWARKRHFACFFSECTGEFLADRVHAKRIDGDFDGMAVAAMRSALALQTRGYPSLLPRREV